VLTVDPTPPKPVKSFGRVRGSQPVAITATGGSMPTAFTIATGGRRFSVMTVVGQDTVVFRPNGTTTVTATAAGAPSTTVSFVGQPVTTLTGIGSKINRVFGRREPVAVTGKRVTLADGAFADDELLESLCGPAKPPITVHSGPAAVTGCPAFRVDNVDDVPPAERSILGDLAKAAGLPLTREALNEALTYTDSWRFRGDVTVNGVNVKPEAGASVVVAPQLNGIVSAKASISLGAGNQELKLDAPANLKIDTRAVGDAIPLGKFAALDSILKTLGSFPLPDNFDVDVKLLGGDVASATLPRAQVTLKLGLPDWLSAGGVKAEGEVVMIVSRDGIDLTKAQIGPISVDVGAVSVKEFLIAYSKVAEGDLWQGSGSACVVSTACLEMKPTFGGVEILNGRLRKIGAVLDLRPLGGVQLYPNVTLQDIGFQLGLDPTVLFGRATVNVYQVLDVLGGLKLVLASPDEPYIWPPNDPDSGEAYPASFAGRRIASTTIGTSATAFLVVPTIGRTQLGGAYLFYEHPGYVAFGGNVNLDVFDIISISGQTNGEINFTNGRFNVTGDVRACYDDICAGAIASVSTVGAGGCLDVGITDIGGGVTFTPFKVHFSVTCRWTRFIDRTVRGPRAKAAQAAPITETFEAGDPARTIQLTGDGEAPRVRVTGPDGVVVESGEKGVTSQGKVLILRHRPAKITMVGIQDGAPAGAYTIERLESSEPIAKVEVGEDPGAPRVGARVSPDGAARVLHYDIRNRPAQKVTFVEVAGQSRRILGTVTGGGKGTLRFRPLAGSGTRRIEAQFSLSDLPVPAETRTVARFRPPSARLPAVRRLRVSRRGTTLRARWKRVAGATGYDVVVTPTSGRQRVVRVRRSRATLRGVARYASGRVDVRALGAGSRSASRRARFRAIARKPSRVRRLAKPPKL
jgi:hypothetical protein